LDGQDIERLLTDRATMVDREQTMAILQECAIRGAFGQLYFPSSNYPCAGNFGRCDEERVELTLDAETQAASLSMFGLCSLYFLVGGRAYLGLSRLIRIVQTARGPAIAEVETPAHLSSAEPRSSARLPVPEECEFSLYIFQDGKLHRARPLNVSLGGMLLDFGAKAPDLEAGSVVQVQGTWSGITLNVPALVRWVDGNQCGVFFKSGSRRIHPASPELLAIVEKLLEITAERRAA
jgi:hypothetical protein